MTSKKYIYLLMGSVLLGLTSCLDKGEETFALEKGDFDKLIETGWKVSSCSLHDAESGAYDSELVNDNLLDYVYVLSTDDVSAELEPDGTCRTLTWDADEESHHLALGDRTFTIESLGKNLMVLTQPGMVNGESYTKKYYLKNIGKDYSLGELEDPDEDATYLVSTDTYGYFRRNGYGFTVPKGAVPDGDDGSVGHIAFSAQSVPLNQLPAEAPAGVTFIEGSGILANPTNFIFASPIIIDVPLRGYAMGETTFYRWNGMSREWETVPYSAFKEPEYGRTSVIELGYFVLGVRNSASELGGVRISRENFSSDYYYYLTLESTSGNGSNSIAFSSNGQDLYMANVPLGEYKMTISREKRSDLYGSSTGLETSKSAVSVEVRDELTMRGTDFSAWRGWTEVDLSAVKWQAGRPNSWGEETVTYGTGVFQATLNWINYTGSTTDYDLHLTTPGGEEIYYSNKTGDGFELDRDVVSAIGNCTENIYSVSQMLPRGTYTVRVNHYGGAVNRTYSCRVILNNRVVKSYTGITNSGYQEIYRFTLQ